MKIYISIFVLLMGASATAQINQRNASRKQHTPASRFQVRAALAQKNFSKNFVSQTSGVPDNEVSSTQFLLKSSTNYIEKAFDTSKKTANNSSFLMTGYTEISIQPLTPRESIRLFPANIKD